MTTEEIWNEMPSQMKDPRTLKERLNERYAYLNILIRFMWFRLYFDLEKNWDWIWMWAEGRFLEEQTTMWMPRDLMEMWNKDQEELDFFTRMFWLDPEDEPQPQQCVSPETRQYYEQKRKDPDAAPHPHWLSAIAPVMENYFRAEKAVNDMYRKRIRDYLALGELFTAEGLQARAKIRRQDHSPQLTRAQCRQCAVPEIFIETSYGKALLMINRLKSISYAENRIPRVYPPTLWTERTGPRKSKAHRTKPQKQAVNLPAK